jgi:phospholipid N-methyltransferase
VQVVASSAERLLAELNQTGAEKPAFVISGIPLGTLGGERTRVLLDAIREILSEGGMYIQFQHSLLDRRSIRSRFPNTRTIPAFLNFPPAFVYYAQTEVESAA